MRIIKSTLAAVAAALPFLALPTGAATFDTTPGGGSDIIVNVAKFDWGPSSAYADRGNQAFVEYLNSGGACPSGQCLYDSYAHGKLTSFQDAGNVTLPAPGLGAGVYEVTYVMGFSGKVVLHPTLFAPVFGFGPSGKLSPPYLPADAVMSNGSTPNFFRMWVDSTPDADPLLGTGYDDGTLVLEGRILPEANYLTRFLSSGGVVNIGGSLGVTPSAWNVGGVTVQTITGNGSTSPLELVAQITYFDERFLPSQMINSLLMSNISELLPFSTTDPSLSFPERPVALGGIIDALTGVAGNLPHINGSASGSPPAMIAHNPSILYQTDPVSPFDVNWADLGDNPDSYATLLASNGPRHWQATSLYMGQCVDTENDGQPATAGALPDGDDNNDLGAPNSIFPVGLICLDDEDGLTQEVADLTFQDGQTNQVTVQVVNNEGVAATLYGWIDFNCNGTFETPAERQSSNVPAGFSGTVDLPFQAPNPRSAGCPAGNNVRTYARFRLSTDTAVAQNPTGTAADGEIEDYPVTLNEGEVTRFYDLGDDPDSYATQRTSNGPRHLVVSSLYMGQCVDGESDGQPGPGANRDDLNPSADVQGTCVNADDEDGVLNPQDLRFQNGQTRNIQVSVRNTGSTAATLYGWIDFSGNGQFENTAVERKSAAVPSGFSGTRILSFTAPANAVQTTGGFTYARFRLSTDGAAANPTGDANDGEVEDYPVVLWIQGIPTMAPWGLALLALLVPALAVAARRKHRSSMD